MHLRFVLMCTLLFALVSPIAAHAAGLIRPSNNIGLIAYWKFNELNGGAALDSSGNGRTGTLSGSSLPTWTTSGKFGNGLSFGGSTSYVSASNPFTSNADFTISVWVKPSAINTGSYQGFIGRQSGGGSWTYRAPSMWVAPSDGALHYDSYSAGGVRYANLISNMFTSADEWVLVTWVKSGTSYNIYRNGVIFSANQSAPATFYIGGTDYDIGRVDNYFGGTLDDVRIYSRALSASEVMDLYRDVANSFRQPSNLSLLGYWKFDEGSGSQVGDSSGNARTATLSNTPSWTSGKFGSSVLFDGSTQYGSVGDINVGTQYTISAWIYPTAEPALGESYIHNMFCDEAPSNNSTFCFRLGSHGTFANRMKCALATYTTVGANDMEGAADLQLNKWQLCTATVDASGATKTVSFYINGIFDRSETYTGTPNNGSAGFRIASSPDANRPYAGRLDEIRLYDRILSASEIKGLYDYGQARLNASSATLQNGSTLGQGLVGLWTYDGADFSDKIYDRSGMNRHTSVPSGIASSTLKTAGKLGQAAVFSGNPAQYFQAAGFSEIGTSNQPYSLVAWVKPTSASQTGDIIHVSSLASGAGWCLSMMQIRSGNAYALSWDGGPVTATGATTLQSGTWYHLVHTWDATNGLRIYVNGALDGSAAQSVFTASGLANYVAVGSPLPGGTACSTDTGTGFAGSIDDARVYSRSLSAAEVKQLYQLTGGR